MSSWREQVFKSFFEIPLRNGLTKPSRIRGSGVRMVNMKELFANDFIDDSTQMELVPVTDKEYANSSLRYGDLLFARQSLVESGAGKVSIYKGFVPTVFESHLIRCRIDTKKASPEYIYYLFKSPIGKGNVSTIVQQVAAAGIRGSDLENLSFTFPPFEEQKAIAEVLSSLDDKIDLLHRQNKTLEDLAQTLFRQWFENSDFDGIVGDITYIQNGYAFKSKDFQDFGSNGVLKIKNISNSIINILNTDFIDESVANKTDLKFQVSSGDILFGMTGAEIGKMGIAPQTNKKLWLNQRVGMLKEKYNGSKYLAYLQLTSEFGYDYIVNTATGSAQPNISGSDIEQCPFVKLGKDEIEIYSSQLSPLFEKIVFNLGQIQTIESLRDTLLPKLLSGEVRVNN